MKGLLVSAAHKSSGKTVLTAGLCAELRQRQQHVQTFKKGPDYIDPKWLSAASGKPCYNLDFHTQNLPEITALFARHAHSSDLAVVEANKGLYDGVALDGSNSNAALAKHLGLPVLLVLDCEGMTRGIAPLLQGYQQFDDRVHIGGVILNRVGGVRHESKLRQAVDAYTDIQVLGAVGKDSRLALPERHIGLIPDREVDEVAERLENMRVAAAEQVDVGSVFDLARSLDDEISAGIVPPLPPVAPKFRLGVFYDSAFHFYYPDDFDDLRTRGAELIFIDALHDEKLPSLDALWIGGGFPEMQAAALEKNATMRESVKEAVEAGLPVYAECGGLMYLTQTLHCRGRQYAMAGVIAADCAMCPEPQGRGYVSLQTKTALLWGDDADDQAIYPAHEFHYSRLENITEPLTTAYTVLRGEGIGNGQDGIVYKNLLATYAHQRAAQSNRWTQRFAEFVLNIKNG